MRLIMRGNDVVRWRIFPSYQHRRCISVNIFGLSTDVRVRNLIRQTPFRFGCDYFIGLVCHMMYACWLLRHIISPSRSVRERVVGACEFVGDKTSTCLVLCANTFARLGGVV